MHDPKKAHLPNSPKPGIDWNTLWVEWLKSRMRKNAFLRSKGLDPNTQEAYKHTINWKKNTAAAKAELLQTQERKSLKNGGMPDDDINDIWQLVQGWRKKQAKSDWETADAIRTHIKLLLNNAVMQKPDPLGGKPEIRTKLTPSQIRSLTGALADLQRIQRLALGMSTENIGVEADVRHSDNDGEKIQIKETIFEVQVNKDGKFVRARPEIIDVQQE